jgi:hydrogenase expression/formation protein HypC
MCLAVPVQVKEINDNLALVEMNDVMLTVGTDLVESLEIGNWVLVHAGYIIEVLTDEVAKEKQDLFEEFYARIKEEDGK